MNAQTDEILIIYGEGKEGGGGGVAENKSIQVKESRKDN